MLQEELAKVPDPAALIAQQEQLAELRNNLVFLYENANRAEKRQIIENVWPNRTVCGKKPAFEAYSWVRKVDFGPALLGGALERGTGRSSQDIINSDMLLIQPLLDLLSRSGCKFET